MSDQRHTLPADVARCPGIWNQLGWETDCLTCRRRTDAPHSRQVLMEPPLELFRSLGCPCYIKPENLDGGLR